ncbi:hypothetical protein VIGAN_10049000, partial [Vigna angularis var. angularis]
EITKRENSPEPTPETSSNDDHADPTKSNQEDLSHSGFSPVSIPPNLNSPVLRGSVSNSTAPDLELTVESTGNGKKFTFRCPCGKAHEILLSGNDHYYKLV